MNIDSSHDLVIVNANIYSLDPAAPRAQALAAKAGRIIALGSPQSVLDVAAREIPESPAVDLDGKTVLPGFIDAHTHFLAGGFSMQSVNLRGCSGPKEFISRIAERVVQAKPGQWVTGGGWDQETWSGSPLPAKNGSTASATTFRSL